MKCTIVRCSSTFLAVVPLKMLHNTMQMKRRPAGLERMVLSCLKTAADTIYAEANQAAKVKQIPFQTSLLDRDVPTNTQS